MRASTCSGLAAHVGSGIARHLAGQIDVPLCTAILASCGRCSHGYCTDMSFSLAKVMGMKLPIMAWLRGDVSHP